MRCAIGVLDIRASCFWEWISSDYIMQDHIVYNDPIWDSKSQQLIILPSYAQRLIDNDTIYIDGVEFWTWIHNKYFNDCMERIFDENNIIYPEDDEIIMELNYAESDCGDPLSWSDVFNLKPKWL